MNTLFERCGGFARVRRIVSDFYDKVLDSPRLQPFFAGTDMRRLIDHQTQFVAWVMGGPVQFNDNSLRRAHAHLDIDRDDYREIVTLLIDAMEDNGIAPADLEEIETELMRREPLIVGAEHIDAA